MTSGAAPAGAGGHSVGDGSLTADPQPSHGAIATAAARHEQPDSVPSGPSPLPGAFGAPAAVPVDDDVASALAVLAGADGVPLEARPALFRQVHARLQDVLDADSR